MRFCQERLAHTRNVACRVIAVLLALIGAALFNFANASVDPGEPPPAPSWSLLAGTADSVVFEPNRGQAADAVRFVARGHGGQFYVGDDSLFFVAQRGSPPHRNAAHPETAVIRTRFLGGARSTRIEGRAPLASASHYVIGGERARSLHVPHFAAVMVDEIYPGVSLLWYGSASGLEFDLTLAPGADPARIRLAFEGAERISLDSDGSIVLHASAGELRHRRPTIYQQRDGARIAVEGRYVVEDDSTISIEIGPHDDTLALVIDPVLSYSSYLGGSGQDAAYGVAVDPVGNVYVAGSTASIDFPVLNAYGAKLIGSSAAFVSKFDRAGMLVYSTYISTTTNGYAQANAIAVDAGGNAYITGAASAGLPVTRNAYQSKPGGSGSAFVAKLGPGGNQLLYATYVQYADAAGIAVDSAGAAFVTGSSNPGFATTAGAFQTLANNAPTYLNDAFVLKLNATGTAAVYSTLLGASSSDSANAVAVDANGQAVVTGATCSPMFPLASPLQSSFAAPGANCHAFVTKLNAAGSALVWSTFLGGSGSEEGNALALDAQGNVYVAGSTSSADFPLTGPYQNINANLPNPGQFVAKIAATGDRLLYSTFIGGTCGGPYYPYCSTYIGDNATGIAVDAAGHAIVVGAARSPYFPLVDSIEGPIAAKSTGLFVMKFVPNGNAVLYSSVIGAAVATAVAIDASGNAWIAGTTGRADFPVTSGARQTAYRGGGDGILVRIAPSPVAVSLASSANPVLRGSVLTISASITGAATSGTVTFMDGATQVGSAAVVNGTATLAQAFPTGIRKLSALYRDGTNEADSSVLYQVVNPADACP